MSKRICMAGHEHLSVGEAARCVTLTADRDAWRERAEKAEAKLKVVDETWDENVKALDRDETIKQLNDYNQKITSEWQAMLVAVQDLTLQRDEARKALAAAEAADPRLRAWNDVLNERDAALARAAELEHLEEDLTSKHSVALMKALAKVAELEEAMQPKCTCGAREDDIGQCYTMDCPRGEI